MAMQWVKPNLETEEEEFNGHFFDWMKDNVCSLYNYLRNIEHQYNHAKIQVLTDDEWSSMANTDSWHIHTEEDLFYTIGEGYGRDRGRIIYVLNTIKQGGIIDAPIVAYIEGHTPYLIAGNTRLSVCKVLGVRPMVVKIYIP